MSDAIKEAMARAFFASAWADQAEECGESLRGEIMDQIPATIDPAALRAAETLARDMIRANGGRSLAELFELAASFGEGDRDATEENFGHYAAMQAMGHGVGIGDAFGSKAYDALRVPYCEFGSHSLARDYFEEKDDEDDE